MTATTHEKIALQRGDEAGQIARPDGSRPPLKANVFKFASGISCSLQPMFPYESAGNLVPCVAVFQGVDGGHFGQFFHWNSVEEIAVIYGSNKGMLATGSVFATQQLHGVNSFLKDPSDPEAYIVITITQRQTETGDQSESILLRCQACSHELVNFKYNATPRDIEGHDPEQWGGSRDDAVAMFPTLWGTQHAIDQYNESEASRTCPECGHVNDKFPDRLWGWRRWLAQQRSVNAAKIALAASAEAELHPERAMAAAGVGQEGVR